MEDEDLAVEDYEPELVDPGEGNIQDGPPADLGETD